MNDRADTLTKELLTSAEAALMLGVTPAKLYALIRAGRLQARRMGRAYLIRRADLDACLTLDLTSAGAAHRRDEQAYRARLAREGAHLFPRHARRAKTN